MFVPCNLFSDTVFFNQENNVITRNYIFFCYQINKSFHICFLKCFSKRNKNILNYYSLGSLHEVHHESHENSPYFSALSLCPSEPTLWYDSVLFRIFSNYFSLHKDLNLFLPKNHMWKFHCV
jgi:hypothetical protein